MDNKESADLRRQLEQARKELAYYKKIASKVGEMRLRETEELSTLIARLKETEKKLRDNEDVLSSLINAIDETLLLTEADGTVLVANEVVGRRIGVPSIELVGTSLYEAFPPDVAATRKDHFDEVVRTGKPVHFQDERAGRTYEIFSYPVLNDAGKVSRIAIFAKDITDRKEAEGEKERLIHELSDALSQVKTLSGMLPICASCKKIRNDKGYWEQLEVYIRNHSDAEFSHSICPECRKRLYPGFFKD